ncbi:hypothetical protein ACIQ7D_13620 [Streptomyces sp. NPDC096310]|uniref:hypothetical protein n=1 Tax=Streptomyces sp. NPDC096310 TaxID=3366082 RepID=UPI00382E48CA
MRVWSTADIPDLTGTGAVVTGANSGIGAAVSLALAWAGALTVLGRAGPLMAGKPVAARRGTTAREPSKIQTRGPRAERLTRLFTQFASAGALPVLRAATDPAARGGQYYGPRGPLKVWGAPGIARCPRPGRGTRRRPGGGGRCRRG